MYPEKIIKTKVAFVYYGDSTFVEQDYNILSKHFDVRKVEFTAIKSIYDIYKTIKWADVSFSWFADVWAFFAVVFSKLFKKKSVVVVGGYDVECLREIGYGMCTKPFWHRWMRTFVLKHATTLLAVSKYTALITPIHSKFTSLQVVYNGVDTNYFVPKGEKENIVLTVASGGDNNIIALKALDKFVHAAKYISDAEFVVVGLSERNRYMLSKMYSSNNVKLLGKCTQADLLKWYQRAKVYCQLSKVESFGMSLAEAMSCECIPVVNNAGALSEVIGNEGYVVSRNKEIVAKIKKALYAFLYEGYASCEHVRQSFTVEQRETKLVEILEKL